uniref:Uncharacterized protein n=1 Tax=Oryza punctata TaxID=4537 RepID=A0A0E0MAR8_ORYPU
MSHGTAFAGSGDATRTPIISCSPTARRSGEPHLSGDFLYTGGDPAHGTPLLLIDLCTRAISLIRRTKQFPHLLQPILLACNVPKCMTLWVINKLCRTIKRGDDLNK